MKTFRPVAEKLPERDNDSVADRKNVCPAILEHLTRASIRSSFFSQHNNPIAAVDKFARLERCKMPRLIEYLQELSHSINSRKGSTLFKFRRAVDHPFDIWCAKCKEALEVAVAKAAVDIPNDF